MTYKDVWEFGESCGVPVTVADRQAMAGYRKKLETLMIESGVSKEIAKVALSYLTTARQPDPEGVLIRYVKTHIEVANGDRDSSELSVFDAQPGLYACVGADPELFIHDHTESSNAGRVLSGMAKRICVQCDARAECLAGALEHDEAYGVWGGTTPKERDKLKKRKSKSIK